MTQEHGSAAGDSQRKREAERQLSECTSLTLTDKKSLPPVSDAPTLSSSVGAGMEANESCETAPLRTGAEHVSPLAKPVTERKILVSPTLLSVTTTPASTIAESSGVGV